MKKAQANANRLSGSRPQQARMELSPMEREEATNRLIGRRVRELRLAQGVTLMQLGEATGVSYTAYQKYEKGETPIDAARLLNIAGFLDVPIGYFFDEQEASERDVELHLRILRIAGRLQRIEQHMPGVYFDLCRMIAKLAKGEE